ncbi:hypothetical protein ACFX2A_005895 [Malus domestica]
MAAEVVLTFATEGILKKVLSLAAQQFSLAWGFKAELGKLQESFTNIELLLNDVADKPQGRPIEAWVKKLKDVAHGAEDVLDELEYEGYRRKVEIQNHMKKKVLNFFSLSNPLAFRLQMAHKIKKINASLVDLKSEVSLLQLVSMNKVATTQGIRWDRQTNAFIGKDEIIIGRQDAITTRSQVQHDVSLARKNEELRTELLKMKMYITDLQKTGSAGITTTSSGKGGGGPKKATFFSSVSKKLGKLNPFKQGSKDTSNIIDDGVDITKPRRRRFSIS